VTGLAFAAAPVCGVAAAVVLRSVRPGEHFWVVFAGLVLICALAIWACVPWWNRLDDMQKQYHTVSWYWGGVGGGIVALMALIAASGAQSQASLGGLSVLLGQTVAFLVFWAVWAWRRHSPAS
jgi:hypothetical protein